MIGHAGMTYGFKSNQGYFTNAGYAISVMTHNDIDGRQPTLVWCQIVKALHTLKGISVTDSMCLGAEPERLKFSCVDAWGKNACTIAYTSGLPYNFCESR